MKKYNPEIPLLSIHVPKCGGTSIQKALKRWFGNTLYFHYFDEKNNAMPKKHSLKPWWSTKYKRNICIHGHFNSKREFGVDNYYPAIKQAIIFLRDPLEIQLSVFHYNHKLSKEGKNYRNGKLRTITSDIDEFLENSSSYMKYFLPKECDASSLESYFSDFFVHVGVMEYYQQSMDILAEKLNKRKITIARENVTERHQTPSETSIKKFKERCSFEYLLYNKALAVNAC